MTFAQAGPGESPSGAERFLMVGRRTDLDISDAIEFEDDWADRSPPRAGREGKLQIARSIDYFAFSRGLYPEMPALAIGRFWWDNWLLWKARSLGAQSGRRFARPCSSSIRTTTTRIPTYGPSKEEMMASDECILNARLTCEHNPGDYDARLFLALRLHHRRRALPADPAAEHPREPRHLWKQFKRYGSRPLGMAKLAQRAIFASPRSTATKAVPRNP